MFYTISEVAKKLNLSTSTLRYYDKEGLLPFVERSQSGIRRFKDSDFEWLELIECLKNTGMSIKNIKKFIDYYMEGDSTINERLNTIDNQRQVVIEQIKQLEKNFELLNYKHWYYETAKKFGTCSIHKDLDINDIPKQFRKIYLKNKQ